MSSDTPKSGDTRQFTVARGVFANHRATLHRFLMRRLHNEQHAQDVAQEVYLRLLRVEDSEVIRDPLAFLYRLALNAVYEFRMRRGRDPVTYNSEAADLVAENPFADMGSAPEPDATRELQAEYHLKRVLGVLPPMMRAVFVLRKRDGMSNKEIAQELNISVHTVKKYLCQAVAQCRTVVERYRSERS